MKDDIGLGILVGLIIAALLIMGVGELLTQRADNANELVLDDSTYTVTIDDVSFVCATKPSIADRKIILWRCSELFGRRTIIKNYSSITIQEN